ncbi:Transport inhibitor response 1-like protein [Linum perenne]
MILNKRSRSETDSQTQSAFMKDDRAEMSDDDDDRSSSSPPDSTSPAVVPLLDSCSNRFRNCASSDSASASASLSLSYLAPSPDQVLEILLENVLCFLTSRRDRNAASLVCKAWYRVEALNRSELFIGNCYAVSPRRALSRFGRIRSLTLKGKPRFADFNLMPPNWGAHFAPWVSAMAVAEPPIPLEKVHLKRMSVTDDDLKLLAESFPGFKELVLVCCEGFSTKGLAEIATKSRQLRVLDLIESEIADDDEGGNWVSCFPDGETCLESLTFDCLDYDIDFKALESLVARSPSLKKLRLNRHVSIGQLERLMLRAPQLTHLGTGSFSSMEEMAEGGEQEADCASAFAACKSLVCLSGFREIVPDYLPAIYPVCANLTSLNFSYANITAEQLKPVIRHCHKLQIFWVLDSICDEGLQAVATTCKELRELRVFPFDAREDSEGPVSEVGLQAISEGCRKLQSILFFCQRMTNKYVLEGCPKLQKLEIRDSPFGDAALLSGLHHYYNMRFLWMSSCKLTRRGCQEVARVLPRLVVEVIKNEDEEDIEDSAGTLYMYRSLEGPRGDVPQFVTIL